MEMYRQGDVLLVRVSELPEGKPIALEHGAIVLAYGEVTGHSHTIDVVPGVDIKWIVTDKGERYIDAPVGVAVKHQEHSVIDIPAGIYQVIIQREYSPAAIRNVVD